MGNYSRAIFIVVFLLILGLGVRIYSAIDGSTTVQAKAQTTTKTVKTTSSTSNSATGTFYVPSKQSAS